MIGARPSSMPSSRHLDVQLSHCGPRRRVRGGCARDFVLRPPKFVTSRFPFLDASPFPVDAREIPPLFPSELSLHHLS